MNYDLLPQICVLIPAHGLGDIINISFSKQEHLYYVFCNKEGREEAF